MISARRTVVATLLMTAVALPAATLTPTSASAATTVAPLGIAAGSVLAYASDAQREKYLQAAEDVGASWLRVDIAWTTVQLGGQNSYDWAPYDRLVSAAKKHDLKILGTIAYAPTWAQSSSCAGNGMCKPRSASEYGTFAGAVAKHFAPQGVHAWEIWNEPNVPQFFQPAPDPAFYTSMLKSAYKSIKAADPKSIVITAGTAPAATAGGMYSPLDFVKAMYAAGAEGNFDVIGTHPYCYEGKSECPEKTMTWSAWSQMSRTGTNLRSVMAAHGDSGKSVWATEYGAPTGGSGAPSEAQQAEMITDGLKLFGEYSWSGPLFVYSLQDRGTNAGDREDWFGILRADGSRKPAFAQIRDLLRTSTVNPVNGVGSGSSGGGSGQPAASPTLVPPVATSVPVPTAYPAPAAPTTPATTAQKSWWQRFISWATGPK
ncbi:cellulase family glycosylhydrolase [Spongisporangium articulatum]|uniref:Cellulase family glycosylhydrolase n=1 Tax=Spongisporangium articulatum TaxID=3362603 RepID=A0ABW8AQD5_9ACTN